MITRRNFLQVAGMAIALTPVMGCNTDKPVDVDWFLSQEEIFAIGKAYHQNEYFVIDDSVIVVKGWVLTVPEAVSCEKKYMTSA